MDPFTAAMAATAVVNTAAGFFGQERQARHNRRLGDIQHARNLELLKYQLDYNTPANQMKRFRDAGLNPHLIYGQGNPGNWSSSPAAPSVQPTDMSLGFLADTFQQLQQMRLIDSQVDLNKVKVDESSIKQDLLRSQNMLVKANPNLNESYVKAMISNLEAAASIKQQEEKWTTPMLSQTYTQMEQRVRMNEIGMKQVAQQIENLAQRFRLGELDAQLKAKVIESKEFANALQKIQVEWMQSGDITPQHIFQGIMLLLGKMM